MNFMLMCGRGKGGLGRKNGGCLLEKLCIQFMSYKQGEFCRIKCLAIRKVT